MGLISRVSSRTYRNRKNQKNLSKMARQEVMTLKGSLAGHGGWVTQIATNPQFPDMLISSSRDKTLIIWQLNRDGEAYGHPMKRLKGHNHFVSDVVVSSCGQFAVSASWDKTLRLWDLERGITTTRFTGHKHDVPSVAFSADNRQIISAGRDKTIFSGHTGYINTVTVSPDGSLAASGGQDGKA